MVFEQFKKKIKKYESEIQNAIEKDSGTNFIQILTTSKEREDGYGAHFKSVKWDTNHNGHIYTNYYYVTFSRTKFEGKNYLTVRRELLDSKNLKILFITDKGYSITTPKKIREYGYAFNGSKRYEKLYAMPFDKLFFCQHLKPESPILWKPEYLAFYKYGETQYRGNFKVEFYKDKACTQKIDYKAEAGSAKALYEKLVHESNFDMKMSTFFYHTTKCDKNGEKVIRYKAERGVLYLKLTIANKKPDKNHRIQEDEFTEELLTELPEDIGKEVLRCDSKEDAETLLFWKHHILWKETHFLKFKLK